jgi:3-hydroxyisobutyrate dehydrogenase
VIVGFIGTGRMGHRMVLNLLKGEHEVHVYDANPAALTELVARGAIRANSILESCTGKDLLFTMMPTPQITLDVYCSPGGILDCIGSTALVIECGTVDIGTIEKLGEEAARRAVSFIDGPVTGGIEGAEAATLTFMVGGTDEQFEKLRPVISLMGKKIVHAGAFGDAMKLKLINNMICATNLVVASEALTLGTRLGLDPAKMYDVISNGTGASWVLNTYYPLPGVVPGAPSSRAFKNPTFPVTGMIKDLHCALDAASRTGAITPLNALALSMLRLYAEQFGPDLDWTAVSTLFRAPAADGRDETALGSSQRK